MIAPFESLKKQEIVWLSRNRCKHRHLYTSHYECYQKERGNKERIGFLDIETSNLKADFGFVFSYCIKDLDGGFRHRCLTPEEIKTGVYDKNLLKQFVDDCQHYDRFVTFFGTWFDLPFLRSRALQWDIDFPRLDSIKHTDMWMIIKKKFKFRNNRLQTACDVFGIKSKGHPMKPNQWWRANSGDQWALDYILTHNKEDCVSTEKLFKKVEGHFKLQSTSI